MELLPELPGLFEAAVNGGQEVGSLLNPLIHGSFQMGAANVNAMTQMNQMGMTRGLANLSQQHDLAMQTNDQQFQTQQQTNQQQFQSQQQTNQLTMTNNIQQDLMAHQGAMQAMNNASAARMQSSGFTQQNAMQSSAFEQQNAMQSTAFSNNLKTNAIGAGVNMGGGLLSQGLGYAMTSSLLNQQASLQRENFDYTTGKAAAAYQDAGLPSWLAYGGSGGASALPHQTQQISGNNVFTSSIPGNSNALIWSGSSSQLAIGTGAVPSAQ